MEPQNTQNIDGRTNKEKGSFFATDKSGQKRTEDTYLFTACDHASREFSTPIGRENMWQAKSAWRIPHLVRICPPLSSVSGRQKKYTFRYCQKFHEDLERRLSKDKTSKTENGRKEGIWEMIGTGCRLPSTNTLLTLQRLQSLAFGFGTFASAKDRASSPLDGLLKGNPQPVRATYPSLFKETKRAKTF
jgi:hypothetical protein